MCTQQQQQQKIFSSITSENRTGLQQKLGQPWVSRTLYSEFLNKEVSIYIHDHTNYTNDSHTLKKIFFEWNMHTHVTRLACTPHANQSNPPILSLSLLLSQIRCSDPPNHNIVTRLSSPPYKLITSINDTKPTNEQTEQCVSQRCTGNYSLVQTRSSR